MARKQNNKPKGKLKIIPLGGLHEVGKNMTAFEYGNDIIIVDCGMSFPTSDMYGIDAVIPSFDYLVENSEKIRGLIITHAHEDHIGGVPYLLQQLDMPIYGSPLSIGFIKHRLEERKITNANLVEIKSGDIINLGCFSVEAIHITHSVADAFSFAINTPVGMIFHTGDFKIDYTPVDSEPINLGRLAQLGDDGVLLLMADSTNAQREGYSKSEKAVGVSLGKIFNETPNRIIITTFSSNVHRVQMIINLAVENGRKVAVSGKSMENMIALASELGYLSIPANTLITLKQAKQYNPSEVLILTTGTQGEPNSALSRIVSGQHKDIKIQPGDVVILSSSIVPGNEMNVTDIVNSVMEKGAKVLYSDIAETHTSGHAFQEELKLILALIRPKFFMPIHGEVRQLVSHAEIAETIGINESNIIIANNGSIIEVSANKVKLSNDVVTADPVLVDGMGVGDVGTLVLNERRLLSISGVIVLALSFDSMNRVVSGPIIKTKGLIYVKEYGALLEHARELLCEKIEEAYEEDMSRQAMEKLLIDTLRTFIYKEIDRNPVIVPIFMEV